LPRGRLGHRKVSIDGRATVLDTPCDGRNPQVLSMQRLHLVVQMSPSLLVQLTGWYECRTLLWGAMGRRVRERSLEGLEISPVAEKEPLQGVAHMPPQVKPIHDLHHPTPHPFGIPPPPIAADDLDTGVCWQPRRDR